MLKRKLAIVNLVGLIFGFVGSVLLIVSLSLKTSNYRLVETDPRTVVICHNNKVVATGFGGPLVTTNEDCPIGHGPSEAPVIETNNKVWALLGLIFVCAGFVLQLLAAAWGIKV